MLKVKKKNKSFLYSYVFLFLSATIIFAGFYIAKKYGENIIEYLIYYLDNNFGNANFGPLFREIKNNIFYVVILFFVLYFPISSFSNQDIILEIKTKKKLKEIYLFSSFFIKSHRKKYTIILFTFSIFFFMFKIGAHSYVLNRIQKSNFIKEQYVEPQNVNIEFPSKKRNLILIYLESIENSTMSKRNGGQLEVSLTPHLENLALDNLNFSNTEKIGGAFQIYGASWTVAGMVASSSGIPLKLYIDGNSYDDRFNSFFPGLYGLGDILKKEGYKTSIMMGSDASFGGRRNYYKTHGDYDIYDWLKAKETGDIPQDYHEWWGFEDLKLFEFAKTKLKDISQSEPFNFIMLTADTHFDEGYLDSECEGPFEDDYENVHWCSSKRVVEFIDWIKKQDFYENTTIVVIGDHLGMNQNFYESRNIVYSERRVFNVLINSVMEPIEFKNREFTQMDFFPTILASLGVNIEGNKLGLGTNLFSKEKTLIETQGIEKVMSELKKHSSFYYEKFLKKD